MNSIEVRCFASLAKHTPAGGHAQCAVPGTAGDLMRTLGVPAEEVAIIFVNGVHATEATELRAGDRVGLFPAVGGG
jgi:sulfur carrier protein ThiS